MSFSKQLHFRFIGKMVETLNSLPFAEKNLIKEKEVKLLRRFCPEPKFLFQMSVPYPFQKTDSGNIISYNEPLSCFLFNSLTLYTFL